MQQYPLKTWLALWGKHKQPSCITWCDALYKIEFRLCSKYTWSEGRKLLRVLSRLGYIYFECHLQLSARNMSGIWCLKLVHLVMLTRNAPDTRSGMQSKDPATAIRRCFCNLLGRPWQHVTQAHCRASVCSQQQTWLYEPETAETTWQCTVQVLQWVDQHCSKWVCFIDWKSLSSQVSLKATVSYIFKCTSSASVQKHSC